MKMGKKVGRHEVQKKSAFVPNASDESVKNIHLWRRISSNSVKVAVCMGYVPSNCPVAT